MKVVTIYEAEDGRRFESQTDCETYDRRGHSFDGRVVAYLPFKSKQWRDRHYLEIKFTDGSPVTVISDSPMHTI